MRWLAVFLLLLGCGGGGSTGQPWVLTGSGSVRTDLLFGYFGENASAVTETADHTNLAWVADFYGPDEQATALIQARAMGQKVVLMVPTYNELDEPLPASSIRLYLKHLADGNLLWGGIVAIYPIDEPQLDPDVIRAQNAVLRAVVGEFQAIAGAKIAVIYACKAGFPGADSYDLIGCDDYDTGDGVVSLYYGGLETANPRAKLIVVLGGADPWRLDPARLADYANGDSNVWAVVAFIWQTADGHRGIRENGMRTAYCTAGRKITQHEGACS